jgi:hypothetical protein
VKSKKEVNAQLRGRAVQMGRITAGLAITSHGLIADAQFMHGQYAVAARPLRGQA